MLESTLSQSQKVTSYDEFVKNETLELQSKLEVTKDTILKPLKEKIKQSKLDIQKIQSELKEEFIRQ